MYNEVDYEFTPLEFPNVVWATNRKFPGGNPPKQTCSFMLPLITKLAKARPKWTLVGINFLGDGSGSQVKAVTDFHVMEGNLTLGRISREYNYGTNHYVYSITNPRIAAKHQRGSAVRTKDVSKAFKIVTKEFHDRTIDEHLAEANKATYGLVTNTMNANRFQFTRKLEGMHKKALAFAEDRLGEFRIFAGATEVDEFLEVREVYEASTALWEAHSHGPAKGTVVITRSDLYVLKKGDAISIATSAQLTPYQRRAIGMLKIAEPNTFIPDIGIKTPDGDMFLAPEKENGADSDKTA